MNRLFLAVVMMASGILVACTSDRYPVPPLPVPERSPRDNAAGEPVPATRPKWPDRYGDHLFDGPTQQDFFGALSQGYHELARERDSASDFADAALFLHRAAAAARGERVWPEEIHQRVLPRHALEDLVYARTRLMRAFDRGAEQKYPRIAARAQVAFDCWMESQEENRIPNYVHRCRTLFEQAMQQIETTANSSSDTPVPAAQAEASCRDYSACAPLRLFFAFDRAELDERERAKLQAFAATALAQERDRIVVLAHTDRAGNTTYNDLLAKRRLEHVVSLLETSGIGRKRIELARADGERNVPVPTEDGVREAQNRVVKVWLLQR